jgi:thiol:disulfide interchange protein DsbD
MQFGKALISKTLLLATVAVGFNFLPATVIAAQPLRPDQAFQVSAELTEANHVVTSWKVAPGYFLYVDKMQFGTDPVMTFTPTFPPSTKKQDPVRGQVAVYSGDFVIPLQLDGSVSALHLNVAYQGCSKDGFCYPPTKKSFELTFSGTPVTADSNRIVTSQGISSLLTDQYGVQNLLATKHRNVLFLVFLCLGILMAFTPCVLPMLPILTGIIAGQKRNTSSLHNFLLSACYVLGMAVTYALAGMLAAYAGGSLQVWLQTPAVIIFSSALFTLLAFSLFEFYELPISRRWQNTVTAWSMRHEGGTFIGVFFMGVLSTLVVSPCVTAPLVGVLLYIGRTGDMLLGGSVLFMMGLGMGLPLMLLGMSAGRWLPKSGPWMHAVTKSFGVVMLGMAIWLLGRIIPLTAMMLIWGLYLVGIALFFSLYLTRVIGRHKINHSLGFATGLLGVFMIGSTLGVPALVNRWTGDVGTVAMQASSDFAVVHDQAGLSRLLAEATAAGRPVLVDFYADWCTSCVIMDTEVFAHKNVQAALQPFKLVRVDLSQNSAADQSLMQAYSVVAPPTVIFFSAAGQEVNSRRIVGEMGAKDFLNKINLFMAASCDTKAQC